MAKSKSARRRNRRDAHPISTRSVPVPTSIQFVPSSPNSTYLRTIEDRRTWTPTTVRSAASFNTPTHRLVTGGPNVNRNKKSSRPTLFETLPTKIGFENPDSVLVCVRRSIRKQVLHALRKTGKKGQKTPRFNVFSKISCRGRK